MKYGKKTCFKKDMDKHLERIVHGQLDVIL